MKFSECNQHHSYWCKMSTSMQTIFKYMRCLQTIYFVFSVPANNFFSIFFISPLSRKIMVRPLGDLAARESTFRSMEETLEKRSASNTLLNGVNKVSLLHTRLNITFQCTSATEYPICSRRVNSVQG